jgi:hypothetical protein
MPVLNMANDQVWGWFAIAHNKERRGLKRTWDQALSVLGQRTLAEWRPWSDDWVLQGWGWN